MGRINEKMGNPNRVTGRIDEKTSNPVKMMGRITKFMSNSTKKGEEFIRRRVTSSK
jgi:hypothetical protein